MTRLIILTTTLLFASLGLMAQVTLERQVVGTAGSYSVTGDIILSSTVGDTATTTLISGSLILTQGFQQAEVDEVTDIEDLMELVVDYQVYPNPTTDLLQIKFESTEAVELQLSIQDMTGRSIAGTARTLQGQGELTTTYSLAELTQGIYLLTFKDENGEVLISHKIQKL